MTRGQSTEAWEGVQHLVWPRERSLPQGWIRVWSFSQSRVFYQNLQNRILSSFDFPGDGLSRRIENERPSDPWSVLQSMAWPRDTEEWKNIQDTVWRGHPPLPRGWIRIWSKSRGQYYLHVNSHHSQMEKPTGDSPGSTGTHVASATWSTGSSGGEAWGTTAYTEQSWGQNRESWQDEKARDGPWSSSTWSGDRSTDDKNLG